ncbi:MAG: cobamide remodeling phosphodiesterase CbiR, partial [Thermodesulfobacteriota bacterium]|nr:cobamide remodeling phosphodiesterase CbiR [Thermodesulfobacteriota bacterium]
AKVAELIDYLKILNPYTYIVHLNLSKRKKERIELWQDRIDSSLNRILDGTKIDCAQIAIENLDYPFGYAEDIIIRNNLSVCIDVGHLINAKVDVKEHLVRYLDRTRVIHLHGIDKNKDHASLKHLDKKLIKSVWQLLKDNNYHGVLTLEVFSQGDFEESIAVLSELMKGS